MLIFRRRKGDSETDSTDLIMCGPTQAWEKKRRKSMSNKWLQDKKTFCLYSWPWKTFCHDPENKNSHENMHSLNAECHRHGIYSEIQNFTSLQWYVLEYRAFNGCPNPFCFLLFLAKWHHHSHGSHIPSFFFFFSSQGALAFVLVGHSHHRAWRTDPGNKFLLLHKGWEGWEGMGCGREAWRKYMNWEHKWGALELFPLSGH